MRPEEEEVVAVGEEEKEEEEKEEVVVGSELDTSSFAFFSGEAFTS